MESTFAGIRVTHPERVIFPAEGLTKLDLVRYYDTVCEWMLPHLRGRPLTLKQCAPDVDHRDYLRNNRTNTSVAAYSARARAGAPVSVPIAGDELSPRLNAARWTIRTLPRRLKTLDDPWAAYFKTTQKLPVEAVLLAGSKGKARAQALALVIPDT